MPQAAKANSTRATSRHAPSKIVVSGLSLPDDLPSLLVWFEVFAHLAFTVQAFENQPRAERLAGSLEDLRNEFYMLQGDVAAKAVKVTPTSHHDLECAAEILIIRSMDSAEGILGLASVVADLSAKALRIRGPHV